MKTAIIWELYWLRLLHLSDQVQVNQISLGYTSLSILSDVKKTFYWKYEATLTTGLYRYLQSYKKRRKSREMTINFTKVTKYLTKLKEILINYVWEKSHFKKQ